MKKTALFVSIITIGFILRITLVFASSLDSELSEEKKNYMIKELNLELVKCPAGSFMMGSPENEKGHRDNEIQHKVTITKPFYIGKYDLFL